MKTTVKNQAPTNNVTQYDVYVEGAMMASILILMIQCGECN